MSTPSPRPPFEINRAGISSGLILLCVGGVLWLAGAVLSSLTIFKAGRSWVSHWEQSPSDIAAHRLEQVKAAAAAGSKAWRAN